MILTREQEVAHRRALFDGRYDPLGLALRSLLEHYLDRTTNSLVVASLPEVPMLQGEAQTYRRLLNVLTEHKYSASS